MPTNNNNMENINDTYYIPETLRRKSVESRVSREIFFIDCINDLNYCAKAGISYHLIRSSVLLRMLLLDGGLETISKNYNLNIQFEANLNEILGTPLDRERIKAIKDTLAEFKTKVCSTETLKLKCQPSKQYSLEDFNKKICLVMGGAEKYYFSVRNIINVVANKNGAAHLEATFDSSSIESFHLAEFSPFSMTDGNFFLEKIKEIIEILVETVQPLSIEVLANLKSYEKTNVQAGTSIDVTVIRSQEEYDRIFGKT
jgi:PIN domain nuclease of toxin-antitoxin system